MKMFFCIGFIALLISFGSNVIDAIAAESFQDENTQGSLTQTVPGDVSIAKERAEREKEAAEIKASLAKLSRDDRTLAEAQGFCPVMVKNRLGVMGTPVKVMIKKQPVFLCCAGCKRRALANPDKTLSVVADLQAKVTEERISASLAKLNPEDRELAEAQRFCAVMVKNRLGTMGAPVKARVNDQPVFLCCAGCKRRALSHPDETLAIVEDLKVKAAAEAKRKEKLELRPAQ